jgi:hypothetical protein
VLHCELCEFLRASRRFAERDDAVKDEIARNREAFIDQMHRALERRRNGH